MHLSWLLPFGVSGQKGPFFLHSGLLFYSVCGTPEEDTIGGVGYGPLESTPAGAERISSYSLFDRNLERRKIYWKYT